MLNYWWVTRPKRKLNSIPEVLTIIAEHALNQEWQGQRNTHLSLEEALEESGLKRVGERRDQTAGGGRTYVAWVISLGLIFIQESTGKIKLTLAGEAIMAGDSPVEILKNQVLKYQFPSSFSLSKGVKVSSRFKIRPFRFLLRLLCERKLDYYLTQEEIGKIIIVEATDESEKCYNHVVDRIIDYRSYGDSCLEEDFAEKYASSKGKVNYERPYDHLLDVANTLINWIEYTQLAIRDEQRRLVILDDKIGEVTQILSVTPPFIDKPEQHEYFQRKYGVDPKHTKDTRNLTGTSTVTYQVLAEHMVRQSFIIESLKKPITKITPSLIDSIVAQTGINAKIAEDTLATYYPHGAVGSFMTKYFEMAFKGREESTEFEKATAELFSEVFGFTTKHTGPLGLEPDVVLISDQENYIGIIDNKAYSKYTISNDHKNRMIHNYLKKYSIGQKYPLLFFSYIAGGFGMNIDNQIKEIVNISKVHGSAISASNIIRLVECYGENNYDHEDLRRIFSLDRQVLVKDI